MSGTVHIYIYKMIEKVFNFKKGNIYIYILDDRKKFSILKKGNRDRK